MCRVQKKKPSLSPSWMPRGVALRPRSQGHACCTGRVLRCIVNPRIGRRGDPGAPRLGAWRGRVWWSGQSRFDSVRPRRDVKEEPSFPHADSWYRPSAQCGKPHLRRHLPGRPEAPRRIPDQRHTHRPSLVQRPRPRSLGGSHSGVRKITGEGGRVRGFLPVRLSSPRPSKGSDHVAER